MNYLEYLKRFQNCDIFLDTFPFNGGTTASDALGMGLPVITLSGESYASRMAGSLLNNLDLNDLIAKDINQYISIAIKVGANRVSLNNIKDKIKRNINNSNIYNANFFVGNYESIILEIFNKS